MEKIGVPFALSDLYSSSDALFSQNSFKKGC